MNAAALERLKREAEAREREEEAFRRESRARLEALTAARVAAYRRYHILKGMAGAAASSAAAEEGTAAALDFALAEAGWREDDRAYGEVREKLAPVAEAVASPSQEEDGAIGAFAAFEAWYRERFESGFLDLLERDPGFLPVVDF
jgi:hypothetical protein